MNVTLDFDFDGMDEEIKKIGDRIVCLTLTQAVELSNYLKYTYGLEVTTTSKPHIPEEFYMFPDIDKFQVVLESFGDYKINVIKEVRALTNMGLKEAKDAVESTPFVIKEDVYQEEAERIKRQLENSGAIVAIKPA